MTSVALIADIHGNMPALNAVLECIDGRRIEDIYCLGDIIGKGPSSADAADTILTRCRGVVSGNWELLMQEHPDVDMSRFCRRQLGAQRLMAIAALPRVLFIRMGRHNIKLFHGRPDINIVYSDSRRDERIAALNAFGDNQCDVACFADGHAPFFQMLDARILMNTGSVGNTCDGHRSASFAILHHDEKADALSCEFVRVPYDAQQAIRDAKATPGMPFLVEYIEELETARHRERRY